MNRYFSVADEDFMADLDAMRYQLERTPKLKADLLREPESKKVVEYLLVARYQRLKAIYPGLAEGYFFEQSVGFLNDCIELIQACQKNPALKKLVHENECVWRVIEHISGQRGQRELISLSSLLKESGMN